MLDKIIGISVVVCAVSFSAGAALRTIIEYPDWWGVALAASEALAGCYITASVIRDRL